MSYASVHFDTPPSVNRIWKPGPTGFFRSAEYKAWRNSAGVEVMASRKQGLKFAEPVEVIIIAKRHNKMADIDNLIKPISDVLKLAGVYADDKAARKVSAEWSDAAPAKGAQVRATVTPISTEKAA